MQYQQKINISPTFTSVGRIKYADRQKPATSTFIPGARIRPPKPKALRSSENLKFGPTWSRYKNAPTWLGRNINIILTLVCIVLPVIWILIKLFG
jgi:hypothetical protein